MPCALPEAVQPPMEFYLVYFNYTHDIYGAHLVGKLIYDRNAVFLASFFCERKQNYFLKVVFISETEMPCRMTQSAIVEFENEYKALRSQSLSQIVMLLDCAPIIIMCQSDIDTE